jgi:signal transduction histidine kinase
MRGDDACNAWPRDRRSGAPDGSHATLDPYASFALIRFTAEERAEGLLALKSLQKNRITERKVELYERVADILGMAIAHRQAQWALRERVKELTCLYGIGRIAQLRGVSIGEALLRIVELLPPAWQFPEIASARIILDGRSYTTPGFRVRPRRQTVDLVIRGSVRGVIEVVYAEDRPEFVEGPFLSEEQSLLDTVAREVSLILDGREADEHQSRLQAQLRHADRLATIGQLAAGVAHELNEPLGNILGFAQLLQKGSDLPQGAASDVGKIVKASLHAREVIHKLLVFSRQTTPVLSLVNLNRIVQDGLYFLESRCSRAGIQVVSNLAPELPDIKADASQLHQVLVNLVVNSIQATPSGGVLTIETAAGTEFVSLGVLDTGCGMTDEIKGKIFTPFFTTKDVNEGTGLGLAVVHGIISSHGGSIHVESTPGKGTRFQIRLPLAGESKAERA